MTDYSTAIPSPASDRAKKMLEARFSIGEEQQQRLIHEVANLNIVDAMVPAQAMKFDFRASPTIYYGDAPEPVRIHRHALGLLAQLAELPMRFVNTLADGASWERELLKHNFEEIFGKRAFTSKSGEAPRFIHRLVKLSDRVELRAVVSRQFAVGLASRKLLGAFVEACQLLGALPVEALASDLRFSLKMMLPHVFEPVPGEFVAFGKVWGNSDFRAGAHYVATTVYRIKSGTSAVLGADLKQNHIGRVLGEGDLNPSPETLKKEAEAQASHIRDKVKEGFTPEAVDRILRAIAKAHAENIGWEQLRSELRRILSQQEVEDLRKVVENPIEMLPSLSYDSDGNPVISRWFGSSLAGWLADRETDPEKKSELQSLAGRMLES